jgi:hypothetical protein
LEVLQLWLIELPDEDFIVLFTGFGCGKLEVIDQTEVVINDD